MKSEVKPVEKKSDKPFPKLMQSKKTGEVLLFNDYGDGMCITKGKRYFLSQYSRNWSMDEFTDFEGTVTLSND